MDDSITAIKNINPKIVIFGSKFFGNIKQLDFIRHGLHTWDQFFDLNSEEQEINEFLINFSYTHNLAFKNYYEIICKDYQKCSNTDGKNAFSYDGDHLTPYGASYFGEKFLKN